MSKVIIDRSVFKDSIGVSAATISTGWMAGQLFTLNSSYQGELANVDSALFVALDSTTELAAPPTGSLLSVLYGGGKIRVTHAAEVAAESSDRAYDSSCESATVGADLYCTTAGKWTTTATGSVKGKLIQVPAAENSYALGLILRI